MATEVGPLCTERQRQHIVRTVTDSVKAGAEIVTGGKSLTREGFYYPPTIIDSDNVRGPVVDTELFGPVLSVQSFVDETQALILANDTPFGLASGLFTRNLSRAHRMTKNLRSGIVWVNTYRAVSPIVPFGGSGLSGHGREGGMAAALDYTRTKAVWIRTSDEAIPDPFVMR